MNALLEGPNGDIERFRCVSNGFTIQRSEVRILKAKSVVRAGGRGSGLNDPSKPSAADLTSPAASCYTRAATFTWTFKRQRPTHGLRGARLPGLL